MFKDQIPKWICRLPRVPLVWSSELQTLEGHGAQVNAVALSTDGVLLASASNDLTVRLWNQMTGEQMQVLVAHSDSVRGVAFSPDGQLLASVSDDCTVWLCPMHRNHVLCYI